MNFDPIAWFSKRELTFSPPHFIKCSTPVDPDRLLWIKNKLSGRYSIVTGTSLGTFVLESAQYVTFEDPADATMYELRWSGSK